jgi:hypothetical protein
MLDSRVKDLAVSLLRQESARDKQRKVGASQISDPCTYHLARALTLSGETPSKYWLGAKIGTAVHMLLEDAVTKADLSELPELKNCKIEETIVLGELSGYGTIKSKPDLMLVEANHLIDWKTSTRTKSAKMQRYLDSVHSQEEGKKVDTASEYTLGKYVAQAQLYAWGLNCEGIDVDNCSLVFINRDGTTEADVWTYTFEYSQDYALSMWSRLQNLWSEIEAGLDIEQLERNPDCFKCAIGI